MGKRSKAEEMINQTRIAKLAAMNASDAAGAGGGGGGGGGGGAASAVADVRSDVAADVTIPAAPFWGSRVVNDIPLEQVYPFINPVALFRGQWQMKKGAMSDAEYDALL
jgi:cobalamin-dependent methionine synthase I